MLITLIANIAFSTVVLVAIVGTLARSIIVSGSVTAARSARRPDRTRARPTALDTAVLPKA